MTPASESSPQTRPDSRPPAAQTAGKEPPRHSRPLGSDTARFVGPTTVSLSDRVLNNEDGRLQDLRSGRKPEWIRARVPGGQGYRQLRANIDQHRLHTVCEEANCPNMGECWSRGTATIMILGDTCTRACGFCNVKTGKPLPPDPEEPAQVAASLKLLGLKHVVITCVDRDDLPDGGAAHWAQTICLCHRECSGMSVEALVGDFKGSRTDLETVMAARPEILAHNLETVRRMHPAVRPQADYRRSLEVLKRIKEGGLVSKTSIMVGIGERDEEVLDIMDDIQRIARTDILTIGQYLRPTRNHLPIDRWVTPEQFERYRVEGLKRDFRVVQSGPMVRSSYHAEEQAELLCGPGRAVTGGNR